MPSGLTLVYDRMMKHVQAEGNSFVGVPNVVFSLSQQQPSLFRKPCEEICMYNLQDPGSMVEDVSILDPLASIIYSRIFWVDHLCEANDQSLD
jgi:hypothetical protein